MKNAVIVSAVRTAMGSFNGALAGVSAVELGALVIQEALHRAGLEGLEHMQQGARAVLAAGGAASLAGRRQLRALDHAMLALNASPGGAADLLAATLFLDRLAPAAPAPIGSN